jgi:hypothetical protein
MGLITTRAAHLSTLRLLAQLRLLAWWNWQLMQKHRRALTRLEQSRLPACKAKLVIPLPQLVPPPLLLPLPLKQLMTWQMLRFPKREGTVTGALEIGPAGSLSFEGSSDDSFETTLAVVNPTADRTITLPNTTGTVITTGDSGTVTSAMIANGTIVNADINASAAIDDTKLATISTAGKVSNSATTATNANTASAIVARDASGDFAAGDITIGDKIIHAGDTDTAIRFPAADTVAVETGGNERLRVSSAGRVGIGITTSSTIGVRIVQDAEGADLVVVSGNWAATTGTISSITNFQASRSTAGATITNLYGFSATSILTSATNNYGFYSDLASATGRHNFYANGTAPNYFAGDLRTDTVVTARTAPNNSNISATATASSLLNGLRTGTPTGNITLTLPTGTDMDAAFQDLQTNQSFEWSVINLAAATHLITVTAAATGHTVVGNMAVAAASSGRFLTRKTAANTFISYRIA